VRRAEQRRELKRQRSISAERSGSTLDVGNGDPKGVTAGASAVCTEPLPDNGAGPSGGRAISVEASDKQGNAKKRQRMSSRDVQLGKVVSDGRMEVAMKTAELRESTALKVSEMTLAAQREVAEETNQVTERIASLDRELQSKVIDLQAKHLERECSKDAREEVMQMTRLYVDGGMKPGEARLHARMDVLGHE
jgi:hypothetical protein